MLPPEPHHDVVLRPLGGGDARTIIATSEARKFVEALFEDLAAADWRARLAAMRGKRRDGDGLLKLSLPVHRKFQLALFEAVCRQPGMPRLDPSKIASNGLVVRRYRGGRWAGWMKQGKRVSGWLPIGLADADPDPVHRQTAHPANRGARALIARNKPPSLLSEEVIPLHMPPPDVCAALKRTVLFAVIPVASDDRSDEPPAALDYTALPAPQRADMETHLSEYLKQRPRLELPKAGEVLRTSWNVLGTTPSADPEWPRLNALGIFLQQMLVELDAEGTGPAPRALMALLRQIKLPTRRDGRGQVTASINAADFVLKAAPILVGGDANNANFGMPLEWPRIEAGMGARLTRAALDCLSARHAQVASSPGKYETLSDQYAVRGFIRVAGHDGCPDRLVWSAFSERFRIAAWWDGDGPGTKITLPDLSQLKKVKPNVSFEMPPAIANLLKGDMKKLAEGEGSTSGLELGWLCSFSIPIITLCAFIVLNIFLSLFDLIFRWMLFLKICIPIPKKAE